MSYFLIRSRRKSLGIAYCIARNSESISKTYISEYLI